MTSLNSCAPSQLKAPQIIENNDFCDRYDPSNFQDWEVEIIDEMRYSKVYKMRSFGEHLIDNHYNNEKEFELCPKSSTAAQ